MHHAYCPACKYHVEVDHIFSVYDPEASNNARAVFPALTYVAGIDAALTDADVVLHLTEWPEFREIDPHRAARLVRSPRMIDGRNRLDQDRWRRAGWVFHGVGRGTQPRVHTPAVVPTSLPLRAQATGGRGVGGSGCGTAARARP